jgi:hypothetical protein
MEKVPVAKGHKGRSFLWNSLGRIIDGEGAVMPICYLPPLSPSKSRIDFT